MNLDKPPRIGHLRSNRVTWRWSVLVEIFNVYFVIRWPIVHVAQEAVHHDHPIEGRARLLKPKLQVLKHASGLHSYVAADECASLGIGGNHPVRPDHTVRPR